jgi:hypothetical protein
MATVYKELDPEAHIPPSSNYGEYVRNYGSNFSVSGLAFDGGSTNESVFFKFIAHNYGSGNVTVTVYWYADTASSGNVQFGAGISVITPNTDTQDIETDTFATATETQDSHLATTGQRLHSMTIAISNLDSLAADDHVVLWFYRDASDTTNDTMAGDAIVTKLVVSYSDT